MVRQSCKSKNMYTFNLTKSFETIQMYKTIIIEISLNSVQI